MQTNTNLKAGGLALNHNQPMKSGVKAGGFRLNHSQALRIAG